MRWGRPRRRSGVVAGLRLPKHVTADTLCDVISERVGKPIRQLYVSMPPELPSGWVAVRATSLSVIIDALLISQSGRPAAPFDPPEAGHTEFADEVRWLVAVSRALHKTTVDTDPNQAEIASAPS
jgi:hypothetical protein